MLSGLGSWKAVGLATEIRDAKGREDCEKSVLSSVCGLLSLSSGGPHVYRWREIRWKRAFEVVIGDTGLGVTCHDHDHDIAVFFLQISPVKRVGSPF